MCVHVLAASTLSQQMELPHDLDRPLQVKAFLDHFPEHLLGLVLALVQH